MFLHETSKNINCLFHLIPWKTLHSSEVTVDGLNTSLYPDLGQAPSARPQPPAQISVNIVIISSQLTALGGNTSEPSPALSEQKAPGNLIMKSFDLCHYLALQDYCFRASGVSRTETSLLDCVKCIL